MTTEPQPAATPRRGPRLPFGVLVLAVLSIVSGVWWALGIDLPAIGFVHPTRPFVAEVGPVGSIIVIAIGVARILAGLGLLVRSPSGWVAAMLLVGFGLAYGITAHLAGRPADGLLLIDVVAAFYLNQPRVRSLFDPRARDDLPLDPDDLPQSAR